MYFKIKVPDLIITVFLAFCLFLIVWQRFSSKSSIQLIPFSYPADRKSVIAQKSRIQGINTDIYIFSAASSDLYYKSKQIDYHLNGDVSVWLFGVNLQQKDLLINFNDKKFFKLEGSVKNGDSQSYTIKLIKLGILNINCKKGGFTIVSTGTNSKAPCFASSFIVLGPKDINERDLVSKLHSGGVSISSDSALILSTLICSLLVFGIWLKKNPLLFRFHKYFIFSSLASIAVLIVFISNYSETNVFSDIDTSYRSGFDRFVISFKDRAFDWCKQQVSEHFPSKLINDIVPSDIKIYGGSVQSEVYYINKNVDTAIVSGGIFGGLLTFVQSLSYTNFITGVLFCIVLLLCLIVYNFTRSQDIVIFACITLIYIISTLFSLRLSEGFDEFFINLRHAYNLSNYGIYSINLAHMTEATVDFVPLILTAALHDFGLNLINGFILLSLLGVLIVSIVVYLYINIFVRDHNMALLGSFLLSLYPGVVWVGASGFTAVLFSGFILLSAYHYLFTDNKWRAIILLSSLTLIRTEGVMFACFIIGARFLCELSTLFYEKVECRKIASKYLKDFILIVIPFLLSLVVRWYYFGRLLPNPIAFKNTSFDRNYLQLGLTALSESISNHDLHLVIFISFIIAVSLCIVGRCDFKFMKSQYSYLVALNAAIFFGIIPYYIGGGDWFPFYWNRYGLPFDLIIFITLFILLCNLIKLCFSYNYLLIVTVFCVLLFGYVYIDTAKYRPNNVYYKTFDSIHSPGTKKWERVDSLASLGLFLNAYTPLSAVVASPEEATVMYFSKREMLGLLGVSNPDMLKMPFQSLNSFGDILYRRRSYRSIYERKPDVIALYEPYVKYTYGNKISNLQYIQESLKSYIFNQDMVDCAYFRVGSYDSLLKMGYHHFTIVHSNILYSMFIHDNILSYFTNQLLAHGYTNIGSLNIIYSVRRDLIDRFIPCDTRLLNK